MKMADGEFASVDLDADERLEAPNAHENGVNEEETSQVDQDVSGRAINHVPPSVQRILQSLNSDFFEKNEDEFDAISEALSNLSNDNSPGAILENLLEKVEKFDLAIDAVNQTRDAELRRNREDILNGMRQVQDTDMETTRLLLHVTATRRRLHAAKGILVDAKLKVKRLHEQRENRVIIRSVIAELVALKRVRDTCYAIKAPLAKAIESTIATELQVREQFSETLKARSDVLKSLSERLDMFKEKLRESIRVLLSGQFDEEVMNDIIACFQVLKLESCDFLRLIKELWDLVVTSYISSPSDDVNPSKPVTVQKGPFLRILDSCKALNRVLSVLTSRNLVSDEHVANLKQSSLKVLAKVIEDHLKSPHVRSQVLDDFAMTIQEAGRLVDRLGDIFGPGETSTNDTNTTHLLIRTNIESSIRQRARIYVQQYQAEGFQAMRGLLWRELWVDLSGGDKDFANQILSRLGFDIQMPPLVVTSTMASGIPRQIQRTLDLMRKLPSSAAGEAFLGLVRIVDLYLLAVLDVFVPSHVFLDSRREQKSPARAYLLAAKEALAEWLLPSSPRASTRPLAAPQSAGPDANGEEEAPIFLYCEVDFLDDSSVPFDLAFVAAGSLEFLKRILIAMETPLSEPLPSVERSKMAAKMFSDVPIVIDTIQALVHRASAERLCLYCVMPNMELVYTGNEVDLMGGNVQMQMFQESLSQLQRSFAVIQSRSGIPEQARMELWDEVCACFFDKYLNAIASMKQCTMMDRGNMILHLASFNEAINSWPQSRHMLTSSQGRAQKARLRVDDYIKAFYYDKRQDLFEWMQRRGSDYEPWHYQSILQIGAVGQRAGPVSYVKDESGNRAIGDWKDLQRDFDKVLNSIY